LPQGPCPVCALRGALELSGGDSAAVVSEQPGDLIGPYRIVKKLGEGGYGIVYLAEQTEPLRRRVALKVIKPGMDTREVIARFEAERHALARMDHPGVAKVFEAGATAAGRPYFVMELVEGDRITDYCDRHELSTRARLDMFIEVCRAVQHAHQKGIIHRDLKPSNILVALQDGKPAPKVIDFGIAKATQEPLTDESVWTSYQHFLGTPAYMSPEQAGLGETDVDTRSDIYALGVLLYELLTGHTPFEKKELLRAGAEEMRRVIRETEPPKPSTRLTQELASMGAGKAASASRLPTRSAESESDCFHRRSQVRELIPRLRGDLDWIVMKCLEKDRARRYESASGLARDVERHLNNEPVTAAAPGTLYRVGKFVRRHGVGLAVAAAFVLLLVAGVVVSAWLAVRATRAERQAQAAETASKTEAAKSRQVAKFLTDMLNGVGPSVALGRDTKMLHEILDKTAERVGKDLKNQPEVEAQLRNTIGNVYEEVGDYTKAEDMNRQSLVLRKSVFGEKHPRVADSLTGLGAALRSQGKPAEAEVLFRQALALRRELSGNEDPEVAKSLSNIGTALFDQGKFTNAEGFYRQALTLHKKLLGDEHPDVALSLHNLGSALLMEGKNSEAEAIFRQVAATRKKLLGLEHPLLATTLANLGTALLYQHKFPEAETVFRQTLAMQRKLLGDEHPDVATSLRNLASVLQAEGELSEAELLCHQALEMHRKLLGADHPATLSTASFLLTLEMRQKVLGADHPYYASTLSSLAAAYLGQGRFADAEAAQRDALAIQREERGPEHLETAASLSNLGDILRVEGKLAEAETVEHEAIGLLKKALGGDHQLLAVAIDVLGNILRDEGKLVQAEASQRETLAMRRKVLASDHPDIAQSLNDLAGVLRAQGRPEEAEPLYREALGRRRKLLGNEHRDTIESLAGLAGLLQERGKLIDAETLAREGLSLCGKRLSDDWRIFDSRARLGGILLAQRRYADAEPLLLAGYDGLKQREERIPANSRRRLKETARQLAQLFDAIARPDQAAEWRKKGEP
jgi:serine/threonine protein kinase/tetratricopeptide (TPR) repeat protein